MQRRIVGYSPAARNDLIRIGRWVARRTSGTVAKRFVARIRERIRKLDYAAERGTVREGTRNVRIIGILPTVAIAFSVEEDAVMVHRILYNGQNWVSDD